MTTTSKRRLEHAAATLDALEAWRLRRDRADDVDDEQHQALHRRASAVSATATLDHQERLFGEEVLIYGDRFKTRGHWFPLGALQAAPLRAGIWHVMSIDGCDFQLNEHEMNNWRDALAKAYKESR